MSKVAFIATAGAGIAALGYYFYKRYCESCASDMDFNKVKYTHLIQKLEQEFAYPLEEMKSTMARFHSDMEKGLKKPGQELKMIPTFVEHLPMGTERGHFLALDLGR